MRNFVELSDNNLRMYAPSIFAEQARSDRSEKYVFIPTIDVVNSMRENGFVPVKAVQTKSRSVEKRGWAKHSIQFRYSGNIGMMNVGDIIPEIVLTNGHDGSSQLVLDSGLFRLACANGLLVKSSGIETLHFRHSGGQQLIDDVIEGSYRIIEDTPKVFDLVEQMREIKLNTEEKIAYANAAISLRWNADEQVSISAKDVLEPIRSSDEENNLWTTMNVVQEKLVRGLVDVRKPNGKERKARGIKNIHAENALNKAIWQLTETMMDLKIAA